MQQTAKISATRLHDVTERMVVERRGSREQTCGVRPCVAVPSLSDQTRLHPPASVSLSDSSWSGELLIRLLDIAGAVVILTVAFPVMVLVSLVIKLTSRGPVLYKQERVGKGGRVFTLYKFRTMIDGAERHVGPVWAARDDERVTRVGRILRRMRIDELPQAYNILRGDMSLVGPRPERPFFVARHTALQGVRLSVKPGLTGLAQVRSFYDLKPAHKVKYDHLYIQRRSFLLNLYILLHTVPVLFARKGW